VRLYFIVVFFAFITSIFAETLTLSLDQRPEWLQEEGLVMAGSWEPLLFRVRRDGSEGYEPTAEQLAAYRREHGPEMIAKLKKLGVNFVMMHCYKGFGLQTERESMEDAVRFAESCHDAGLHVGVYTYSGAFGWELLFKETPEAKNWVVLNDQEKPICYGGADYRYYWNRNHPDAQSFYKKIIRFAVEEIRTDLLHFDNYAVGPGKDDVSIRRFRDYLRNTFDAKQLEAMGVSDMESVQPPMADSPRNLLKFAWIDFCCQSLADSYHEMGRYARTLRGDILLECNPGGVSERIREPIDHGRLLTGGEAFWDEGRPPGLRDGKLQTRIRTYKTAARMNNLAFAYCTTPLEMAETMAFNLDCLGCIVWFEYDRLVAKPASDEPVSPALDPFIRFYKSRRDVFRDTAPVADVAVLRSFPSQTFAEPKYAELTARVEQLFIENRIPFQIIYDGCLDELDRYRILVLAGCVALSDDQIRKIERFVKNGGKLCIIGETGIYDEWIKPRNHSAFTDAPETDFAQLNENEDWISGFQYGYDEFFSMDVDAPLGLCAELTERKDCRFVHLVNYRTGQPMENIPVRIRIPRHQTVKSVTLLSPMRDDEMELDFLTEGEQVLFEIPRVDLYEVARICY
jgi:hypothetical protein